MPRTKENKKAIAYYADSAFSGILILDIIYDINDYIVFCSEINGKRGKLIKSKIRYTIKDNKPYFIHYKRKYFLDEFLKIDF